MPRSIFCITLALAVVAGCSKEDTPRKTDLEETEPLQEAYKL